ncbi:MAG: phosphotransferase [Rhizomicrobium sp.]
MGIFDVIPEPKRDAAKAAVAATCGSRDPDRLVPLSGGASGALILRVEAGAQRALLRVEGTPSPLRNPHQYISMRIASDAGIAPKLLHVDEANGIAVIDFIEQKPLQDYPGGPRALAQAMGGMLRRVQDTPLFPFFVEYPDIVARLFAHVRRTGLFAPGLLDRHVEHLADLDAAHGWDNALAVSSHNDLNARNILFDGERLWLIDWESAYRNDPLVDLAVLLDNIAPTPELEDALVQAWQGRGLDHGQRRRLAYVRALTRLYFAGVLLSASATVPRDVPDNDLSVPALADFQPKPGTLEGIHMAGKIYLASFLSGAAVPALHAL